MKRNSSFRAKWKSLYIQGENMNKKDEYFNIFPKLKSKNLEKYVAKDNITWLKSPEEVPVWLTSMFKSKDYTEKMDALKKINVDSMNCRVENN